MEFVQNNATVQEMPTCLECQLRAFLNGRQHKRGRQPDRLMANCGPRSVSEGNNGILETGLR